MVHKALSLAEAKATLSEVIREAESGSPVLITRHGKPVAALVRAEDLATLDRLRSAGPQHGLASIAGGWEGSDELAESVSAAPRRGRRHPPPLE